MIKFVLVIFCKVKKNLNKKIFVYSYSVGIVLFLATASIQGMDEYCYTVDKCGNLQKSPAVHDLTPDCDLSEFSSSEQLISCSSYNSYEESMSDAASDEPGVAPLANKPEDYGVPKVNSGVVPTLKGPEDLVIIEEDEDIRALVQWIQKGVTVKQCDEAL